MLRGRKLRLTGEPHAVSWLVRRRLSLAFGRVGCLAIRQPGGDLWQASMRGLCSPALAQARQGPEAGSRVLFCLQHRAGLLTVLLCCGAGSPC